MLVVLWFVSDLVVTDASVLPCLGVGLDLTVSEGRLSESEYKDDSIGALLVVILTDLALPLCVTGGVLRVTVGPGVTWGNVRSLRSLALVVLLLGVCRLSRVVALNLVWKPTVGEVALLMDGVLSSLLLGLLVLRCDIRLYSPLILLVVVV